MAQEVRVKKTLLPSPTIDDLERKLWMIEYRAGELPSRFVYIPEKEWTAEKQAELIKADIQKRMKLPEETITL